MISFAKFLNILVALTFIVVGTVLLLGNLGYLGYNPIELLAKLWPIILILLGLYFLVLRIRPSQRVSEGGDRYGKRTEQTR